MGERKKEGRLGERRGRNEDKKWGEEVHKRGKRREEKKKSDRGEMIC